MGESTERDIGRLEGQIMSITSELNSINVRHRELVEDTTKRLDKIDEALDNINSTMTQLNAKASQWKVPTAVILGLGTVGAALLEWAYRKLPDFWGAIR